MGWSRRQIAAVSALPVLFAGWMVMRFIPTASVSQPATERATGQAETSPELPAAQPTAPPLTRREPAPMVTSTETTTDDKGRFQLRGLASGAYRVTFGAPTDREYTRLDGVRVNELYGVNLVNLKLQASSASGSLGTDEYRPNRLAHIIRGNVVDARGAPVAGIRVRAERQGN